MFFYILFYSLSAGDDVKRLAANGLIDSLVRPVINGQVIRELCINLLNWDSLIVAAALEAECTTLYSEDMQHGQNVEGQLRIINPLVGE